MNSISLNCNCGCTTLNIDVLDEFVYFSFKYDLFFTKQNVLKSLFFDKINQIGNKLFHKKNVLCELIINESEAQEFIRQLNNIRVEKNTNDKEKNCSYISITKDDELKIYYISLISKQSLKDCLLKEHYAYEIVLNKKQFNKFRRLCNEVIKE